MNENTPITDATEAAGIPEALRSSMSAGPLTGDLSFLMDVELRVSVELGRSKMRIDSLLDLGPGGIIKLDKLAGEPLDVRVNDRLIAHGEAVVMGEKFGVRLIEVLDGPGRN